MDEFQFIQPWWLILVPPLVVLAWWVLRHGQADRLWRQICDAHLLPYLIKHAGGERRMTPVVLLASAWTVTLVALSRPSVTSEPVALHQADTARVIVLDLSRSMDATDVVPSRLEAAKFKVRDILARSTDRLVALVIFAAEPYAVSPLTTDAKTLEIIIAGLESALMPHQGTDTAAALRLALALLRQAGVKQGDVVLVTDGADLRPQDSPQAEALLKAGHRLAVLLVGSTKGAPIPMPKEAAGAPVISQTEALEPARFSAQMPVQPAISGLDSYGTAAKQVTWQPISASGDRYVLTIRPRPETDPQRGSSAWLPAQSLTVRAQWQTQAQGQAGGHSGGGKADSVAGNGISPRA